MPNYEYECPECNHIFVVNLAMDKMTDYEPCPCCGKDALRIISPPAGFILKGKGFYKNDYGNKKS